jgi:Leucine-rich repeat (LRR) protein
MFISYQTLTTLNIGGNQIDVKGFKYLLLALHDNTVSENFLPDVYYHHITKTLTTLDLNNNQIGDEGAEYLADILQNNSVRKISYT